MKNILIIFLSLLLALPLASAQSNKVEELNSLDFKLKIGEYSFTAPYYFPGDIVLDEGYLIAVSDLALLKVDIESFESTMSANLNLLSKQCQKELSQCQEDADQRFINLVKENEFLTEKLSLQKELYEAQKIKTVIYTVSGILVTGLTSFLIVKAVY
jgi:hypothetical protein